MISELQIFSVQDVVGRNIQKEMAPTMTTVENAVVMHIKAGLIHH